MSTSENVGPIIRDREYHCDCVFHNRIIEHNPQQLANELDEMGCNDDEVLTPMEKLEAFLYHQQQKTT